MNNFVEFLTPVGRLVTGDCFTARTKDRQGNPLTIKRGPNAGQPRVDYYIGLAISKTDPGLSAFYQILLGEARRGFPNLFDASGNCLRPDFAFKFTDGDSTIPNKENNKPCDQEGFPGNFVFHFSGSFAPKCYSKNGAALLTDSESIKRGYYIRVYGNVKSNDETQNPGIYLNHNMIELVGYGKEIVSGPSGTAVFGGTPATTTPTGMSAVPLAPSTPIAPAIPVMGTPGMQAAPGYIPPAGTPASGYGMPSMVQSVPPVGVPSTVQPIPSFLNPPAVPVAPSAPPAPVERRYRAPDGNVYSHSQFLAARYTEQQIATLPVVPSAPDIPF